MIQQKHTQGTWIVEGSTIYKLGKNGYNEFSANVQSVSLSKTECEAIAKKMGAADELLAVLECLFDEKGNFYIPNPADLKNMQAAIAKAKGDA